MRVLRIGRYPSSFPQQESSESLSDWLLLSTPCSKPLPSGCPPLSSCGGGLGERHLWAPRQGSGRTDLDVVAMEGLEAAPTLQDRHVVLTDVLPGPPVIQDAYKGALELGQELDLTPGPLSALLGIVRQTIIMCTETPLLDVEECYTYLSELLLRHAVHCPPVSAAVFGLTQVAHIAAHLLETVLRHARLYGYILTPQTCLDLTLVYMGSPEHGQEVEVSTALLQEEGEIPGSSLQEVVVAELVQVAQGWSQEVEAGLLCGPDQHGTCLSPAEISMTKEDASGSHQTSPRSKKHLGKPQGSCQGNKGLGLCQHLCVVCGTCPMSHRIPLGLPLGHLRGTPLSAGSPAFFGMSPHVTRFSYRLPWSAPHPSQSI
uniref:Uncharacterized protein n=1 Tax=Cairina moschata TaxID=8855 RepID=A0A8C3CU30_CAIMO